jgi:dTDP-glucose 4,6-dehydratase
MVTGGAGFIGSGFIRWMLARCSELRILNFDALTYAGNLENLRSIEDDPRYLFFRGDIRNADDINAALQAAQTRFGLPIDCAAHFAAESHVDRSIEDPSVFLQTNVLGTEVLLRALRAYGIERFVHVSTDEVYGSLSPHDPAFTEENQLSPNSPYAASKAGSDLLVRAYVHTYGFPALITRCSNNYGPFQFPEKLIPLMICCAMEDKPLPVYGDGMNVRDWIYVDDHSSGIDAVLRRGEVGEVYNLGGHAERPNMEIVRTILRILQKPETLVRYVEDRPGHDRRYAMDTTKAERELGWRPRMTLETGLEQTIRWYVDNQDWVSHVRSGEYREYLLRQYGSLEQCQETVAAEASSDHTTDVEPGNG